MILAGIFSLAHILFFIILALKWQKIPVTSSNYLPSFSVVVPVRNEERNIEFVLRDLENQTYQQSHFEIIVVDDFSDDRTADVVMQYAERSPLDLKIIRLENPDEKGKKHALTKGIAEAKHELIITTDADCRLPGTWLESFAKAYNDQINIVAGPVTLQGAGLFSQMQKVEFSGLLAFGAVTLSDNNPSMCSGANLSFRKQAFEEVGGYASNIQIPSGDDEFLLYDIVKKFPNSGKFLKSKDAMVITKTHESSATFFNQRLRWINKWRHNKNWKLRLIAILFFFDYLILVGGLIGTLIGLIPIYVMLSLLVLRLLSDYVLLRKVAAFSNHSRILGPVLILQIFYPFHVLFMGVISIFGNYSWKGRRY